MKLQTQSLLQIAPLALIDGENRDDAIFLTTPRSSLAVYFVAESLHHERRNLLAVRGETEHNDSSCDNFDVLVIDNNVLTHCLKPSPYVGIDGAWTGIVEPGSRL